MEAFVILSLFVALALLSARFGSDSREQLASTEEAFARQGFAWHGVAHTRDSKEGDKGDKSQRTLVHSPALNVADTL